LVGGVRIAAVAMIGITTLGGYVGGATALLAIAVGASLRLGECWARR